ncbi:hypothetical protein GCM10009122_15520 [Fulvivirga kasyanovii]|uniref:Response regulator n=1 Tax=Fulvivirga kasyanovii TaxID=396812 RepID=A0ABW9RW18_9BACT|nr:response regulator [Fulvivirga kasyanovii]MTI28101.1 response regulator [Fulvivirga kasyanovii]
MKKILVIDDTLHLLEEIRDLLQMEGYDVITAYDAFDGMRKISTTNPDLIITDLLMPEMNGFELITKIRSIDKHQLTPIIVLSAQATKETEQKAREYSADAYIRKPCSADQLISSIEKLLK